MGGAAEKEPTMLDLLNRADAAGAALHLPTSFAPLPYRGPERRGATMGLSRWLSAALDEIDYGIVLIGADGLARHVNQVARCELDAQHPLVLLHDELRARCGGDAQALRAALHDAQQRGLRKLLTLGDGAQQVSVSVVPLGTPGMALVILGKRQMSAELAVQGFARVHRLTAGEARVLCALCAGAPPAEIAAEHGVALSTVRTQIGSIRQKTGAQSIRALLAQVARLPPLMGRLRGAAERLPPLLQGMVLG
jgi:DNA-binding CsgD family transcriptional regulator